MQLFPEFVFGETANTDTSGYIIFLEEHNSSILNDSLINSFKLSHPDIDLKRLVATPVSRPQDSLTLFLIEFEDDWKSMIDTSKDLIKTTTGKGSAKISYRIIRRYPHTSYFQPLQKL